MNQKRVTEVINLYAELDPAEKLAVDQELWYSRVKKAENSPTMSGAQIIAMMEAENLWWDLDIEDSLDYVRELRRQQWAYNYPSIAAI